MATANLESALQNFNSASTLYLMLNFNPAYAYALMDIGSVQQKMGALEEARKSYEEALEILEELGDNANLVNVHSALGQLSYEQKAYTSAIESFENALELTLNLDNNSMEAAIRHNLGLAYQKTENLSRAADEFQRALEIYVFLGDKDNIKKIKKSINAVKQKESKVEKGSYVRDEAKIEAIRFIKKGRTDPSSKKPQPPPVSRNITHTFMDSKNIKAYAMGIKTQAEYLMSNRSSIVIEDLLSTKRSLALFNSEASKELHGNQMQKFNQSMNEAEDILDALIRQLKFSKDTDIKFMKDLRRLHEYLIAASSILF